MKNENTEARITMTTRNNEGLKKAKEMIQQLRAEFWENVLVPGSVKDFNQSMERAGRVADFLEFGELMLIDALPARNHAADILTRHTKLKKTRHYGMTKTSATLAPGNLQAKIKNRYFTKKSLNLRMLN